MPTLDRNAPTKWNWKSGLENLMPSDWWYAAVLCWDLEEGMFPGAVKPDGKTSNTAVIATAGPFDSEKTALAWAREHDPEATEDK